MLRLIDKLIIFLLKCIRHVFEPFVNVTFTDSFYIAVPCAILLVLLSVLFFPLFMWEKYRKLTPLWLRYHYPYTPYTPIDRKAKSSIINWKQEGF